MKRPTYRNTRCVDGRTMRHDPQPDDPGLETDIGQCEECDGKGCIRCEACGCDTRGEMAFMDHVGESWCHPCADNYEAAWERHCEDFHDGGATRFRSLLDDQAAAQIKGGT